MEKVATSLITREPAGPVETETLLVRTLERLGLDPDDPTLHVEYFVSDELPPIGLPLHEEDQLRAHIRDAGPDARFFTVMVSDEDEDPEY